jgi:MFS family permease
MLAFLLTQYLRQDKEPLLPFAIFKDRNYSSITLVVAVVNFAILGLSLPLTIYLQSVLGLSAFEAGLTLLPQALISMLIAGPAGGLADRVGGKYILIGGLVLFAAGMGYVDWIADVNSGRWSFLPGLIVAGVGVGFTWTPLYNIAMRDVQPRVAGVAAGIFSTIQELGGVIAGAAVGALLQDRLAAAIQDEATQRAGQLPSEFRDRFLDGFRQGTGDGVEFGTNQAAGGVQATPGMPARVAEQLEQLAKEIFKNAFVEAMHLTLILPIAVVLLAVISCFAVRQGKVKTRPESIEQVEDAA